MADASSNTLGLDFNQLQIKEDTAPAPSADTVPSNPTHTDNVNNAENTQEPTRPDASAPIPRDKKKPYVNLERVNTGGSQRDKLSDEALTERMARMREQNEKIKQRRMNVEADEEAFRQTQESERAKHTHNRKVQESIDRAREQNAKRKMEKIQSREWDSGKPARSDWKSQPKTDGTKEGELKPIESIQISEVVNNAGNNNSDGWTRGGPLRGGRGRGRGRGGAVPRGGKPRSSDGQSVTSPPPASDDNGKTSNNKVPESSTPKNKSQAAASETS
ncbi:hypothetical protein BDQ12DRAFT_732436 [Crucibulum laeve]|uniref:Uncharacterized protein n=1 Tax=Crucibulum laeve TaxID=68775 RepID=A0A5C3MDW5_9AGAR|nr:hypothetical protein BDQ12DRAFT_732436 [Crucibulum laeve]